MDVKETIEYVRTKMLGRIADDGYNTAFMAATTLIHGDHLEIGTMHGGSAIVVALLKKQHGFYGKVTCIDPLNGYYIDRHEGCKVDPMTGVPVDLETLRENERRFCVELEIIQAKSIPFPVSNHKFATAYIDGDHWNNMPTIDFIHVAMITTDTIVFDNCDEKHPDVMRACEIAEQIWEPYFREDVICAVKHP